MVRDCLVWHGDHSESYPGTTENGIRTLGNIVKIVTAAHKMFPNCINLSNPHGWLNPTVVCLHLEVMKKRQKNVGATRINV